MNTETVTAHSDVQYTVANDICIYLTECLLALVGMKYSYFIPHF